MKKSISGFTLVELLIVIVVIAILATISIVAYNGIQDRARTTSGQILADQVKKSAEFYNVVYGGYPSLAELTSGSFSQEVSLPSAAVKQGTMHNRGDKSLYENGEAVLYRACYAGSSVVNYWDYTTDNYVQLAIGDQCVM